MPKPKKPIFDIAIESQEELASDCQTVLNSFEKASKDPAQQTLLLMQLEVLHQKINGILNKENYKGEAGEFTEFYVTLFDQLRNNNKLGLASPGAQQSSVNLLLKVGSTLQEPDALVDRLRPELQEKILADKKMDCTDFVTRQMGQPYAVLNYIVPAVVGMNKYESVYNQQVEKNPRLSAKDMLALSDYVNLSQPIELKKMPIPLLPERKIINKLSRAENKSCEGIIGRVVDYNNYLHHFGKQSENNDQLVNVLRAQIHSMIDVSNGWKSNLKEKSPYQPYANALLKNYDDALENIRLFEKQQAIKNDPLVKSLENTRASVQDTALKETPELPQSRNSRRPSK